LYDEPISPKRESRLTNFQKEPSCKQRELSPNRQRELSPNRQRELSPNRQKELISQMEFKSPGRKFGNEVIDKNLIKNLNNLLSSENFSICDLSRDFSKQSLCKKSSSPRSSSRSSPKNAARRLKSEDLIIDQFVDFIRNMEIQLACFDFDNTIIYSDDESWKNHICPGNIAREISPLWIKLARKLLNEGISVNIVTYNENKHIEEAVCRVLEHDIYLVARSDHELATGKSYHLDKCIEQFNQTMGVPDKYGIRPSNVLFADDDDVNQNVAIRNGYNVIKNKAVITLDDLVDFMHQHSS
jgi:hypothetical protein